MRRKDTLRQSPQHSGSPCGAHTVPSAWTVTCHVPRESHQNTCINRASERTKHTKEAEHKHKTMTLCGKRQNVFTFFMQTIIFSNPPV